MFVVVTIQTTRSLQKDEIFFMPQLFVADLYPSVPDNKWKSRVYTGFFVYFEKMDLVNLFQVILQA